MKFWWQKQPSMAAELDVIRQATIFVFGGIGFANRKPAETEAYFALGAAIADGADLRAALIRLVDKATPAGRLYAAELLEAADPAAAAAAWQKLRSDKSQVETGAGCIIDATTIAEYAEQKTNPAPPRPGLDWRATPPWQGGSHATDDEGSPGH